MQRIALFGFTERSGAVASAEYAATRLLREGAAVIVDAPLAAAFSADVARQCECVPAEQFERQADVVISFGGDGTLLAAARLLMGSDMPIMGVNVGRLGFLAEFPQSAIDQAIVDVVRGTYRIVDRTTLEVSVGAHRAFALNDVLVERSASSKMIAVRSFVNEHHVADYRADGVIVTTPTGSTAYSLAAGGPIIVPSANALCITPVSPHMLTLRPLIIPDDSEIRFDFAFEGTTANLVADGQKVTEVASGDVITIRRSEHLVKLIKRADSTYYDLLREKLLWSADPTSK
ncbi:MAG: NAD(+) kinase [Candidatus Kapabacteria bacterium]|nr:NAD(+) kinase [Candidatus Kapabacteria bacterium]